LSVYRLIQPVMQPLITQRAEVSPEKGDTAGDRPVRFSPATDAARL
jgi:hypothetical protein